MILPINVKKKMQQRTSLKPLTILNLVVRRASLRANLTPCACSRCCDRTELKSFTSAMAVSLFPPCCHRPHHHCCSVPGLLVIVFHNMIVAQCLACDNVTGLFLPPAADTSETDYQWVIRYKHTFYCDHQNAKQVKSWHYCWPTTRLVLSTCW